MSTNSIITRPQITPATWEMISTIAPAMHASRLFGINSPDQAAAIMLKGYELGLGLTASFEFIHIIQGKPSISPRGHLALIFNDPNFGEMKVEEDKAGCTVWMKRKNGFEFKVSYTLDEAKKAGLIKPESGWEKYPANMLRWRAIGYCADVVFPDVGAGMKRSDELGADITPDGDVIEGSWNVRPVESEDKRYIDLLASVDPGKVLTANDGIIPNTLEELQVVVERMKAE